MSQTADDEATGNVDNFIYFVFAGEELTWLDTFYRTIWPRIRKAFEDELRTYASLIRADLSGTVGRLWLIYKYNYLVDQIRQKSVAGPMQQESIRAELVCEQS